MPAGAVDYGIKVVELLTTTSSEVALRIAQELDAHNRERRAIEAEVLEQGLTQARSPVERPGTSFPGARRRGLASGCLGYRCVADRREVLSAHGGHWI